MEHARHLAGCKHLHNTSTNASAPHPPATPAWQSRLGTNATQHISMMDVLAWYRCNPSIYGLMEYAWVDGVRLVLM